MYNTQQKLTIKELQKELDECNKLWSKHSCDCLAFEINYLIKRINDLQK